MSRILICLFRFFLLAAWATAAFAQGGTVGQVIFVSGEVEVHAGAEKLPVKVGDSIREGQELITRSQGYAYVKTSDNGFISLRPNSAVHFEIYQYAADRPQDSKLKINLKYGVMRSISGIGAQSARDKYRLNTPVAAIGIRGTDFTVFATDEITRAAVTSGGIVMSGFNDKCTPGGLGPCSGTQIAELFAQQSGMLLQLRRGDAHPVLLDKPSIHLQPDGVAPPLPNESAVKKPDGQSNAGELAGEQAIVTKQDAALQETLSTALHPGPSDSTTPPVVPPSPPPPVVPAPTPEPQTPPVQQIFWGRWFKLADESATSTSALAALTSQSGKQLLSFNSMFGVVRDQQTDMALPSSGVYNFSLQSHESYVLNEATKATVVAQIANPALSIDFNQRRFNTSFDFSTNSIHLNVSGQGSILGDGTMVSDLIYSKASILGGLANGGQQAAYIYQQRIDPQQIAVGATYWTR